METPIQDAGSRKKSHDDSVISYLEAVKFLKQRSSVSLFLVPNAAEFPYKDDHARKSRGRITSKQNTEWRENETTKRSLTPTSVSERKSKVSPKLAKFCPEPIQAPSTSREEAPENVDGSIVTPAETDVRKSNRTREVQTDDSSHGAKVPQDRHSDRATTLHPSAPQHTNSVDEDNIKNVPKPVRQLSAPCDISVITIDETNPEVQKRAKCKAQSHPKSYNLRQRRRSQHPLRGINKASGRMTQEITITIPDVHAEVQKKISYVITEVAKSFHCIVSTREIGVDMTYSETRRKNAPGMVYLPIQNNPLLSYMPHPTGPRKGGNQSKYSAKNMAATVGQSTQSKTLETSAMGHEGLFYPEVILKEEK